MVSDRQRRGSWGRQVLILVLMEDGLGPVSPGTSPTLPWVLMLVLMEDGLGHDRTIRLLDLLMS